MEYTAHIPSLEPFPSIASMLDSAPTTPQHDSDAPILATSSPVPIIERRTPSFPTTASEALELQYEGPLYTEINIPLPSLPTPSTSEEEERKARPSLQGKEEKESRGRSRTLSSLSPFRHRRSLSISSFPSPPLPAASSSHAYSAAEEWPRVRKDIVKSREVNAAMNLQHHTKRARGGSIDALAVVPAILVLSAELFTPGEGNGGRWKDGIR